jgi:hypothetical protein
MKNLNITMMPSEVHEKTVSIKQGKGGGGERSTLLLPRGGAAAGAAGALAPVLAENDKTNRFHFMPQTTNSIATTAM